MRADATLKRPRSQFVEETAATLPLRDRVGDWIFPPKGVERAPVSLSQRRVYILPTKAGMLFALTLALMLVGSINYNLSLGYGLTFLLTGTGIVSILHTWRNLAHLKLRPGKTEPVFAGDVASFSVLADNQGRVARHSVTIRFGSHEASCFDVGAGSEARVQVRVPAPRRGVFRPGRFRIFTTYPLGLFYAWANVELDLTCLVYPAPESGDVALPEAQASAGPGNATGRGEEDFAGLRNYRPGDSPRRIAWKSVARNDVFATKLFSGATGTQLWIDFADMPESLGLEQRLSRMTRWVLDATHANMRYGLRLPGREIEFGSGEAHQTRCLEALALYRAAGNK
ncbi:MAG: DUF58 domain-containing protein [Burkholderiales bacterium]|jgi:uncharacterized protein (DUF58 family)